MPTASARGPLCRLPLAGSGAEKRRARDSTTRALRRSRPAFRGSPTKSSRRAWCGPWRELGAKPGAALRGGLRSRLLLAPIGDGADQRAVPRARTPQVEDRRPGGAKSHALSKAPRRVSAARALAEERRTSAATPQATAAVAETRERPDAAEGRFAVKPLCAVVDRDLRSTMASRDPCRSFPTSASRASRSPAAANFQP